MNTNNVNASFTMFLCMALCNKLKRSQVGCNLYLKSKNLACDLTKVKNPEQNG